MAEMRIRTQEGLMTTRLQLPIQHAMKMVQSVGAGIEPVPAAKPGVLAYRSNDDLGLELEDGRGNTIRIFLWQGMTLAVEA